MAYTWKLDKTWNINSSFWPKIAIGLVILSPVVAFRLLAASDRWHSGTNGTSPRPVLALLWLDPSCIIGPFSLVSRALAEAIVGVEWPAGDQHRPRAPSHSSSSPAFVFAPEWPSSQQTHLQTRSSDLVSPFHPWYCPHPAWRSRWRMETDTKHSRIKKNWSDAAYEGSQMLTVLSLTLATVSETTDWKEIFNM